MVPKLSPISAGLHSAIRQRYPRTQLEIPVRGLAGMYFEDQNQKPIIDDLEQHPEPPDVI